MLLIALSSVPCVLCELREDASLHLCHTASKTFVAENLRSDKIVVPGGHTLASHDRRVYIGRLTGINAHGRQE